MDEYGCLQVSEDDAAEVRNKLINYGSVVFPLTGGNGGAMIVLIADSTVKIGIMPFGGNPSGRVWVSIYGIGCAHFAPQETEASYFAEKLHLGDSDAKTLAEFWSLLWGKA